MGTNLPDKFVMNCLLPSNHDFVIGRGSRMRGSSRIKLHIGLQAYSEEAKSNCATS